MLHKKMNIVLNYTPYVHRLHNKLEVLSRALTPLFVEMFNVDCALFGINDVDCALFGVNVLGLL